MKLHFFYDKLVEKLAGVGCEPLTNWLHNTVKYFHLKMVNNIPGTKAFGSWFLMSTNMGRKLAGATVEPCATHCVIVFKLLGATDVAGTPAGPWSWTAPKRMWINNLAGSDRDNNLKTLK